MTGPEHYKAAERCIGWAEGETDRDKRASLQARAQVHATLAHAAATALNDAKTGIDNANWSDWNAVCGDPEVAP